MELNELLEQITPLPWHPAAMDNDKLIPTIRLFGRHSTTQPRPSAWAVWILPAMPVMAATLRMRCRTWSGRSTFCWQTNDAPGPSCHAASFTSARRPWPRRKPLT